MARRGTWLGRYLCGLTIAAAGIGAAWATPNNTAFVDPKNGADNVACGGADAPCQTLDRALNNITAGGSVYILSGGTFGPVYLTGAVTIVGPADQSAVITFITATPPGCIGAPFGTCGLATANFALEVAAGIADTIKLKNLTIDNANGTNGAVKLGNAFNVSMDRVVMRGGTGTIPQIMTVAPAFAASQFQLFISHCDVGFSASGGGILLQPQGSASVESDILASEIHNARFGLKLDGTATTQQVRASVTDTEFFAFNGSGVALVGTGSGLVFANLIRNNVMNAGQQGVQLNGLQAQAVFDANRITRNHIGVNTQGTPGSLPLAFTYSNNRIVGNSFNCEVNGANAACATVLSSPLTEF